MLNDFFQLSKHYYRDSDKENVNEKGRDLLIAALSFSEIRRVMKIKGLRLSLREYYNLRDKGRKRNAQEKLQYVLRTLKTKGFKVRIKEKYIINENIRQSQEVKFFFFISLKQIRLARQFASHFVVIIDITFNINKNDLFLLVLICVINTLKTILIVYYFIESEFIEAFLFMNDYIKNLFFYNDCRGPGVLLGDFAVGLTAAMVKKRTNLLIVSED